LIKCRNSEKKQIVETFAIKNIENHQPFIQKTTIEMSNDAQDGQNVAFENDANTAVTQENHEIGHFMKCERIYSCIAEAQGTKVRGARKFSPCGRPLSLCSTQTQNDTFAGARIDRPRFSIFRHESTYFSPHVSGRSTGLEI